MKIDRENVKKALRDRVGVAGEEADELVEVVLRAIYGPAELRPSNDKGQRWPQGMDVPEDWLIEAERMGVARDRAEVEAERFVDYWISEPGAKGRKVNWRATWRNWVRRALGDRVANATRAGRANDVRY